MVITQAFQACDTGSIPAARSISKSVSTSIRFFSGT